tara:strand:+ start:387 stop:506 length:120 start_codon:yes stop_codon:yes gene_type:complete
MEDILSSQWAKITLYIFIAMCIIALFFLLNKAIQGALGA